MTMKMKRLGIGMALALVLGVLLGYSPGHAADKFVTYLSTGPLTGPGAAAVLPAVEGMNDYFTDLNARGGIEGVRIDLIAVDDRYDVARGISAYQRHRKAPKLVGCAPWSTATTKALLPLATADKVPLFTPGGGQFQAKIGWAFLITAPYQNGTGAAFDWIVADWKKKGRSGAPTVGYLGWDNAAGKDAIQGADAYAKKLGINLLQPEFFPPSSLKHDTWLTRLAEKGAQYIYVFGVDPSPTNVIRDAYALGLTKKIQFVHDFWGPMSTEGVKNYPTELDGVVVCASFVRGEERLKHPMAALFTKYRKKPLEEMNPFYLVGISLGQITEEGLKIALKDVGYDKISGQALYDAVQKLTGRDITKGIIGRIAYSPTDRMASKEVKFYQVQKGKLVPISDWITAPDCVSLTKN